MNLLNEILRYSKFMEKNKTWHECDLASTQPSTPLGQRQPNGFDCEKYPMMQPFTKMHANSPY